MSQGMPRRLVYSVPLCSCANSAQFNYANFRVGTSVSRRPPAKTPPVSPRTIILDRPDLTLKISASPEQLDQVIVNLTMFLIEQSPHLFAEICCSSIPRSSFPGFLPPAEIVDYLLISDNFFIWPTCAGYINLHISHLDKSFLSLPPHLLHLQDSPDPIYRRCTWENHCFRA